jgi:hypothetical protein
MAAQPVLLAMQRNFCPHRKSKGGNSYILQTLSSEQLPGSFSARRLRTFTPKEGTKLAEEQMLMEDRVAEEGRRTKADENQWDNEPPDRASPDTRTGGFCRPGASCRVQRGRCYKKKGAHGVCAKRLRTLQSSVRFQNFKSEPGGKKSPSAIC